MLKPYGPNDVLEGPFDRWERKIEKSSMMTPDMKQALKQMNRAMDIPRESILTEGEGPVSIVEVLLGDEIVENGDED